MTKEEAMRYAEAAKGKLVSGQVPEGDARLNANKRADLHMKLKIKVALEGTATGEILEHLIERNLE